jgi:ribonuclease J
MSTAELAEAGFLPAVRGLFDDQSSPDAILLSHAHLDHTGLLDRSCSDIPVYATAGTSKMALAGAIFANQIAIPRHR